MLDDIWVQKRNEKIFFVIMIAALSALVWFNWVVGLLFFIITGGLLIYIKKNDYQQEQVLMKYLDDLSAGVTAGSAYAIKNLPVGIAIMDEKRQLVWANNVFRAWAHLEAEEGGRMQQLFPGTRLSKLWGKSGWFDCHVDDSYYRVFHKFIEEGGTAQGNADFMAFYLMDRTDMELTRRASEEAMPVFCQICIDNFSEVAGDLSDVEKSALLSDVNECVLAEFSKLDGFIKQYSSSDYVACISKAALQQLMKCKFDILDKVRNIRTVNRIPVTLSIGVVQNDEISFARQSEETQTLLDLALGRGGDQAVVRMGEDVKVFGGKAPAVGSRTRVRVRVVAQAIRELITESDLVLVMGHSHEDYDALGAAVGVAHMARASGIPVHVVVSKYREVTEKMRRALEDSEDLKGLLISEDEAEKLVTDKTVLFCVDTHRPDMVAAPPLLPLVSKKVIIDHHRRSNSIIGDALLVYMEPSASSASELVTELIQYYGDDTDLLDVEASCLYVGIVVDTKNFAVQTGVRTFDAASYLRRSGANVGLVRELFTVNIDMVKVESAILSGMEVVDGYIAFAECPEGIEQAQIVAGQLADYLITIEGIRCSFLFYHDSKTLRISARSDGSVNVQVVMEKLGGGGHMTVSGAQLKENARDEARTAIIEAVRAQTKEETT